MINENEILQLIGTQVQSIINENQEVFAGYNFTITNELQFVKNKKNKDELKNNPKTIFIVIKFLPATLNYGQVLMPIIINAMAEKNKLDVCYRLLIEYAETCVILSELSAAEAKLARLEAIQAQTEYDEKYGEKDGNN